MVQGKESAYNLDTALRLQAALEKAGVVVVMTRSTDVFLPLAERARIASAAPDAIFISIHFDSQTAKKPMGVRVEVPAPDAGIVNNSALSAELGATVQARCVRDTGAAKPAITQGQLAVLRESKTLAAIMVNGGNMFNPLEAAKIATDAYRETLAQSIAKGVRAFAAGREE